MLSPETVEAIGAAEARRNRGLTFGIWAIVILLIIIGIVYHLIAMIALQSLLLHDRRMASITIRQLDEALKKRLRLRAAQSGRSVEDEVRTILREAADGDRRRRRAPPSPRAQSVRRADGGRPHLASSACC